MTEPERDPGIVVLFDAHCVLCSRSMRFILAHERDQRLRFAGTGSAVGRDLAARHGLGEVDLDQSFVLLEGTRHYLRSDAAIEVARHLARPWCWLALLRVVPRPWRDAVYAAVARRRYRLFGRRDDCFVPPAADKARFLDMTSSAPR